MTTLVIDTETFLNVHDSVYVGDGSLDAFAYAWNAESERIFQHMKELAMQGQSTLTITKNRNPNRIGLSVGDMAAAYGGFIPGDKFAPVKQVNIERVEKVTNVDTSLARIEHTKWFDAATKIPGQPGVFEVNSVSTFDTDETGPRRFSYHNGRDFGPVMASPADAFAARFNKASLQSSITAFRGLSEQG